MERGRGIEPLALAWKAKVLPLYEPRELLECTLFHSTEPVLSAGRVYIRKVSSYSSPQGALD